MKIIQSLQQGCWLTKWVPTHKSYFFEPLPDLLPLDGLFPLPFPEGRPVLLGPFLGLFPFFAIFSPPYNF